MSRPTRASMVPGCGAPARARPGKGTDLEHERLAVFGLSASDNGVGA